MVKLFVRLTASNKHPVQAIGIVAGALLMLGSAIWTVVRAII
jgi:hypothetical protein